MDGAAVAGSNIRTSATRAFGRLVLVFVRLIAVRRAEVSRAAARTVQVATYCVIVGRLARMSFILR